MAHPRSRGENDLSEHPEMVAQGSSPLTRGKHLELGRELLLKRLIPAHAGKTANRARHNRNSTAHPRSRGENTLAPSDGEYMAGSSPLTRGKRGSVRALDALTGLIPAHAGKTRRGHRLAAQGRAHPRSRGENAKKFMLATPVPGSSPLTRGKPWADSAPG